MKFSVLAMSIAANRADLSQNESELLYYNEKIRGDEVIELTEVTATLLYESLEEAGLSKDCGLRLIREEGRLNLHLDLSMPDDWVIAYKDRLLMIICTASEIGSGRAKNNYFFRWQPSLASMCPACIKWNTGLTVY